jgi:SAM-dependent methyltransferase
MSDETKLSHGVMEGQGAYNKYAKLPAGGAALAMPLLESAVHGLHVAGEDRPLVIADYGSSQGKNSFAPLTLAIKTLRSRFGPARPIFTYHIDQPSNDFNSLFEVLDADPNRYTQGEPNVFPAAIGRSFYGQVLPAESVDLGWSSYAAVWLSRVPGRISGHFIPFHNAQALAEFAAQAATDWESFLALRARELRPGGRLVVVLPARDERGLTGFEVLMDHANEVLADLVATGGILAEERARMALGTYPRQRHELLAPFARDGQFQQLVVEDCEFSTLEDAVWADYEQDGDKDAFAARHALFFRSIFVPTLATALTLAADPKTCRAFADQMEHGLKRRLASQPVAMHSFVSTLVLAKSSVS